MATRIFLITGTNPDGTAILTNNGNLTCDQSDVIQWNINPGSGVSGICIAKTGGSDIFSSVPAKLASSNNWQGTISASAGGLSESYSISASPCNTENAIWHDPQITVNR